MVLQLVDIVAVPLWAGPVLPGASISGWDIVKDLLLLVLAPLAVGLILRARYRGPPSERQLRQVANVSNLYKTCASSPLG